MIQPNRSFRSTAQAAGLTAVLSLAAAGPAPTRFVSPGEIVQTDLSPLAAREAALRLRVLRPLLAGPAWGFPTPPAQVGAFNVELFNDVEAFTAAGGPVGVAGVFLPPGSPPYGPQTGPPLAELPPLGLPAAGLPPLPDTAPGRVLVLAGPVLTLQTWHLLQHEAFHQYAYAACNGRSLLPWLDEGLAEYVGEALFTGDGYVTGVIPPWRLARLQAEIRAGTLPTLSAVLGKSREEWSLLPIASRYDQVWSLVHFLKHADAGKYAPLLAACVRQGNASSLPTDVESRWQAYWLSQPPNPTADLFVDCVRQTLNSFLDRATASRQRFTSFADFHAAATQGQLTILPDQWLPASLLIETLDTADACGEWRLTNTSSTPRAELEPRTQ